MANARFRGHMRVNYQRLACVTRHILQVSNGEPACRLQCAKYTHVFSLEFLFPSHIVTTCLEKDYVKDGKSKGISP